MKRITAGELLDLKFGTKIRVVWHNSEGHKKNKERYGVIFGHKIGYEVGLTDEKRIIAECMRKDWCMVYVIE